MASKKQEYRSECDSLGEIAVPVSAYWGVRTARYLQNAAKVQSTNPRFLEAALLVHKAHAQANADAGRVERSIGRTLSQTVDEILSGQWREQFVVSLLQPNAVADYIANIREVLANRAGEILGAAPGSYSIVHPEMHVGLSRKPAEDFSTALRIAVLFLLKDLEVPLRDLERLLRRKALDFDRFSKSENGASSKELAHSLNASGADVAKICRRIQDLSCNLNEIPFCKNAGTEYGADALQAKLVCEQLSSITGFNLRVVDESVRFQSNSDFVEFSAGLRLLSLTLNNILQDKPEFVPQAISDFMSAVSYQVVSLDAALASLAQSGLLRSEAFMALAAQNILLSVDLLRQCISLFNQQCINGSGTAFKLSSNDRPSNLAMSI